MKRIAVEEHFVTQNYMDYLRSRKNFPVLKSTTNDQGDLHWRLWHSPDEHRPWYFGSALERLLKIGETRLKDMDQAGIQMQVLSCNDNMDHLNEDDCIEVSRKINDDLYAAVKNHPDRFIGLATLAPREPEAAAQELERTVKHLGFKGALLLPHVLGEYIDDPKYWPIYAMASRLGVPVYVHPTYPSPNRLGQYSGYPELGGALWGYGAEASLVAVRLICSGVFDEYPDLTVILGHLGEALPFWMWRMDNRILHPTHTLSPLKEKLKKLPSQYIKNNFLFTTSGMLSEPALLCTHSSVGADRILFATDYPHESGRDTVEFLESAPVGEGDKEKIFHLNAERVFGF